MSTGCSLQSEEERVRLEHAPGRLEKYIHACGHHSALEYDHHDHATQLDGKGICGSIQISQFKGDCHLIFLSSLRRDTFMFCFVIYIVRYPALMYLLSMDLCKSAPTPSFETFWICLQVPNKTYRSLPSIRNSTCYLDALPPIFVYNTQSKYTRSFTHPWCTYLMKGSIVLDPAVVSLDMVCPQSL